MHNLIEQPGRFRSKNVGIIKGSKVEHVAPDGSIVTGLMKDLFDYLKNDAEIILIKSCVFHYEFEFIHPFIDGNGRLGRLWQTLILSKWHPLFLSLPLESVIKDNQKKYYQALEQADKEASSTAFIGFMLSAISKTLVQNAQENAPINASQNASINPTKTPDAVLMLIKDNPQITRKQIADALNKDLRTIGRSIAKLQEAGKLKRVGSNKTGHWQLKL
jgi:Fic family protein